MALTFWWMIPVGVVLVAVAWRFRGRLRRAPSTPRLVAHSERLTRMPAYVAAFRSYVRTVQLVVIATVVVAIAALVLAARPSTEMIVNPVQANRDIVLCLDVSGSMKETDQKIVKEFQTLIATFHGQRIGMTIFNSSPVTIFPLTDDYELMQGQLERVDAAFTSKDYTFFSGTYVGETSSNIGAGVLSCVNRLGDNSSKRSQSIILATDNEASLDQLVHTSQAMILAKNKGIRIYSLDPGVDYMPEAEDDYLGSHSELRTYSIATGGDYYRLNGTSVMSDVVSKISRQEAKLYGGDVQVAYADQPLAGFIVALVGAAAVYIVIERYRLW